MGLNSNKKDGMALVLILVILASLMVVVAGSLKVITSLNPSYSINRNATEMRSSKISGSYLCYKEADGKIKYKRVDYNPDGTFESKEGNNCVFKVPIGASEFDVYILGAGGKGAQSSYTITYNNDSSSQVKKLELVNRDNDEALKNVLSETQVRINARPTCNGQDVGFAYECPDLNIQNLPEFYDRYLKNKNISFLFKNCPKNRVNRRCVGINGAYYITTISGNLNAKNSAYYITTLKPIWNYELTLTIPGGVQKKIYFNDINGNADSIIDEINAFLNKYQIKVHEPLFNANIGSAGAPGELRHIQLKGNMFVPNKNDEIKITKNDIADGKGIEKTIFRYKYQASRNDFPEIEKEALSGASGSSMPKVYKKIENLYSIESQEGILPQDFNIPSAIKFKENLYPGYIDEGGKPKDATYFGASGASGYLNFDMDKRFEDCTYSELFNIDSPNTIIYQSPGARNCSEESEPEIAEGSNGAPGAILIKW